ncbi:hypothetical protein D3C87_1917610 [compost metagenome]
MPANASETQSSKSVEPIDRLMTFTISFGDAMAKRQPTVAPITICAAASAALGIWKVVTPEKCRSALTTIGPIR